MKASVIFTFGALKVSDEDTAYFSLFFGRSLLRSYVLVFSVLAELGGVQVFTPVVFRAVCRPVRCLNWTAACRADNPSHTHHPSVLSPHFWAILGGKLLQSQPPLLIFLLLSLLLPLLLALGPITCPV